MRDQLTGASDTTRTAKAGMIDKAACLSENNSSSARAAAGFSRAMYSRISFRSVLAGRVQTSLTS